MKDIDKLIAEKEAELAALRKEKGESSIFGFYIGDDAYCITTDGSVKSYNVTYMEWWKDAILQGNTFHTREEAEFEAERRKVVSELKYLSELSGEKKNLWNCENTHWYINYDCNLHSIDIGSAAYYKDVSIFFATRKAADDAIKKIGEDRIKKYYLEVKE